MRLLGGPPQPTILKTRDIVVLALALIQKSLSGNSFDQLVVDHLLGYRLECS